MAYRTSYGLNWRLPWFLTLALLLLVWPYNSTSTSTSCSSGSYNYNTSSGPLKGNKLNVHLVAHTHDDVGWLKTVDQYYAGLNNSYQGVSVQLILDSVVALLQEDPNRKFIYVEQAFFQRWWRKQSKRQKEIVRRLVDSGQLEFINGGWCMHDEAATHYIDMIDQTTLGHRFIKQEFGKIPKVAWQIDPFGHSSVQAYLLGAEIGFDALYFARIDYQDKLKRKKEKSLEFVWQGSKSLGSSAQIFTGIFPELYTPPNGFVFETGDTSTPIQDDVFLFDYNVKNRVDDFVDAAIEQANMYRTNHIMFTMGQDFTYQNAWSWFKELDKLIHYVNLDGRVNAFYSTPSIYTTSKFEANETWPLKTADFFPYADKENAYWTGYFTSRPSLKGYVRMMSGYYLAARQLEAFVGRRNQGPNTDALADALGTAQHHDAVSGTEKQHVAYDYATRLHIGSMQAAALINSALSCLASLDCISSSARFEQCMLLNISYCPPTESLSSSTKTLVVVAYNPIGWSRSDYIRLPVRMNSMVVRDKHGKVVQSQLIPISNATKNARNFYAKASSGFSSADDSIAWLVFKVSVPPLGFSTYFISTEKGVSTTLSSIETPQGKKKVIVGSGKLQIGFSSETGRITELMNHEARVGIPLEQAFMWYESYDGTVDEQASGAYIFRPNKSSAISVGREVETKIIRGPLLDEVHQKFGTWISQIIRLYKDKEHAEVEITVGPIPIYDGFGKEVITRLETSVSNDGVFYTDSNGRDFLKRVRNFRSDWDLDIHQPVAGNYYPINLGMYIKDNNTELSVLVDRAIGGSSISDGHLELMLHRRLVRDDGRGVAEALNEIDCADNYCQGLTVQGKICIGLHRANKGSHWRRTVGQQLHSPLLLAFTTTDSRETWTSSHVSTYRAMDSDYTLPDNVALITLQELEEGDVIIRLAHLFEVEEDLEFSSMATVHLKSLFASKKIKSVTEVNLSTTQEKYAMKNPLKWHVEGESDRRNYLRGRALDPSQLIVELGPMEIRTFLLAFN